MQSAPRALIAGLGLIGGSIGMALRRRGWHVSYVDPNVSEQEAQTSGAADERLPDGLKPVLHVVIHATPVDVALDSINRYPADVVTSVCSVMQPLRAAGDRAGIRFIAGHPLAGSAARGLPAANEDLFRDKLWFIDREDPIVKTLITDCGAQMRIVESAEHDAAVALTSHIPQILSTALAAYLNRRDVLEFAGTGLETFLRLAESDAALWVPIVDANRANIERHIPEISAIVTRILAGDPTAFQEAQSFWRRLVSSRPR